VDLISAVQHVASECTALPHVALGPGIADAKTAWVRRIDARPSTVTVREARISARLGAIEHARSSTPA
jgi:hypothetical protein